MLRNASRLYSRGVLTCTRPNLFIRQGLTQTDKDEQVKIQAFMDWIAKKPAHLLLGKKAKSDQDFREEFELMTGKAFTPENFRQYRLDLIARKTDGFVFYWGKALSVSGGYEVGALMEMQKQTGKKIPIFFAEREPIKTTLLRELPGAFYCRFEHPQELEKPFNNYLAVVQAEMQKRQHIATQTLGLRR